MDVFMLVVVSLVSLFAAAVTGVCLASLTIWLCNKAVDEDRVFVKGVWLVLYAMSAIPALFAWAGVGLLTFIWLASRFL